MSFENVIGNSSVKELLLHSINSNNILHSYMFVGPNGIGKCLIAEEFARIILDNLVDIYNNPDFMLIQPDDGKSLKIEQIRYLQEKIAEKPIVSSKKVYIIDDSDSMTKEAQNCLLKTLEEPPAYAVIILIVSNENKMLTTIKSRCMKMVFNPLTNDEITSYFTTNNLNIPNSNVLKVCNGSIGKAIALQNQAEQYEQIDYILNNFEQKDIIDIWNNSGVFYQAKDIITNLLEYTNIILLDKLQNSNDLRYANCIQIVEESKKRLSSNANYDMCIDNMLLKMWEEFHEKNNRC